MESISKFENNVWSIVGSLLHKRAVHASILYNGEIFITGGEAPEANCWGFDNWEDQRLVQRYIHFMLLYFVRLRKRLCLRACRNAPAPLSTEIWNIETGEQREIAPEFCGREYGGNYDCYDNFYYHPILLLVENGFCSRN